MGEELFWLLLHYRYSGSCMEPYVLMNGLMYRSVVIGSCTKSEASSSRILPSGLASESNAPYVYVVTNIVILVCDESMSKEINMCGHLILCMYFRR